MRRVLCFVTGSPPAHTRSGGAPHRGQLSTPLLPGPLPLQSSPCNSTGTCKRLVAAVSGHGGSAGRAHGPGHRRRPHNRRRRPAAPVEPTAPGNRSATAADGRRPAPATPATVLRAAAAPPAATPPGPAAVFSAPPPRLATVATALRRGSGAFFLLGGSSGRCCFRCHRGPPAVYLCAGEQQRSLPQPFR